MYQSSNQKENNPMKKLLIILLLISPFSFADCGDIYYCQMTSFSKVTFEGKRTNYTLEKLQFKLDKTKNAMVFGKSGIFKNTVMELREGFTFPSQEVWFGDGEFTNVFFQKGKFLYSNTGLLGLSAISADCDKF